MRRHKIALARETRRISCCEVHMSPIDPSNAAALRMALPGRIRPHPSDLQFLYIMFATTKRLSPRADSICHSHTTVARDAGGMIPDPHPYVNSKGGSCTKTLRKRSNFVRNTENLPEIYDKSRVPSASLTIRSASSSIVGSWVTMTKEPFPRRRLRSWTTARPFL